MQRIFLMAVAAFLTACATPGMSLSLHRTLSALLPADVLLIGEQHDAPDHQRLQREAVLALARQGQLAALALEMAESGRSTRGLPVDATEQQVRAALAWKDSAWPWSAYGPTIMAAVQAGVLVAGANLPSARMRGAMTDAGLDSRLDAPALDAQHQAIRDGHCGLLPDAQIGPMTRIQIARDLAMATTAESLAQAGKTVLLIAGGGHVLADRGIPRHVATGLQVRSLLLRAGPAGAAPSAVDATLHTPPVPAVDHCQALRERLGSTAAAPAPAAAHTAPASR